MRASALKISTIKRVSLGKMDASSKEVEFNGCYGDLLSPCEKFQPLRSLLFGKVAPMVERLIEAQCDVGSTPTLSTMLAGSLMAKHLAVNQEDESSNLSLSARLFNLGSSVMVAQWTLNPLMVGSNPPSSIKREYNSVAEYVAFNHRIKVRFLVLPFIRTEAYNVEI